METARTVVQAGQTTDMARVRRKDHGDRLFGAANARTPTATATMNCSARIVYIPTSEVSRHAVNMSCGGNGLRLTVQRDSAATLEGARGVSPTTNKTAGHRNSHMPSPTSPFRRTAGPVRRNYEGSRPAGKEARKAQRRNQRMAVVSQKRSGRCFERRRLLDIAR
jgi:hypothetical protein